MKNLLRTSRHTLLPFFLLFYLFAGPALLSAHAHQTDGYTGDCTICFIGQHFQPDVPGDNTLEVTIREHLFHGISIPGSIRPLRVFPDSLGRAPPAS